MKRPSRWFFCLFIFILPLIAAGDTILLRNGNQVIGTIISINDQEVTIDVNGVPVRINRADIQEIIRKEGQGGVAQPPALPAPAAATPEIQAPSESLGSLNPLPSQPQAPANAGPQVLLPVILPHGKAYQVIGESVRFRKGPSLDDEVVDSLMRNTVLVEMETKDTWLHAKTLEGVEGWIHPSFIPNMVRPMEYIPCLVNGARVHIRESQDELSLSLSLANRGDVVIKLDEQGGWSFVLCNVAGASNNAAVGWCSSQLLTPMQDAALYRPPMRAAGNEEMGTPVLVEKNPDATGAQQVTFTIRDPSFTLAGKTKLIVFHQDPNLFTSDTLKYVGGAIVQKDRLDNALTILEAGFPSEVAGNYVGADLLTLIGEQAPEGWKYTIATPNAATLSFGFIAQDGPNRGTLIVVK